MMQSRSMIRFGGVALVAIALAACSKESSDTSAPAPADTTAAAAPAAPAAAAPAPDNTDTVGGQKLASFTGNPAAGETVFLQCKTCHDPQVNKIGPHLAGVVGRHSGSLTDYTYTPANKNSGITWTPEKLFQYLENPQRVIPGTKMAFAGIPDPQKRADVIAYLGTLK